MPAKYAVLLNENIPQLSYTATTINAEDLPSSTTCKNTCDTAEKDYATVVTNAYCPGLQKCCGIPKTISGYAAQTCAEACAPFLEQAKANTIFGANKVSAMACTVTTTSCESITPPGEDPNFMDKKSSTVEKVRECGDKNCCCNLWVYNSCSDRHPDGKWGCLDDPELTCVGRAYPNGLENDIDSSFPFPIEDALAYGCGNDSELMCCYTEQ